MRTCMLDNARGATLACAVLVDGLLKELYHVVRALVVTLQNLYKFGKTFYAVLV